MPTKPTTEPEWNSGGANNVEPSGGKKALGWLFAEKPLPSGWFNWWMKLVYEWIQYLNDPVGTGAGPGLAATGGATGGSGLKGTGGATDGTGVEGIGGASNGIGVKGTGDGTGAGGNFTGGDSSGPGVSGTGGASNGYGGTFQGDGNGVGVEGIGGDNSGGGAYGQGGAPNGYGLLGIAVGTGNGTTGIAEDGYGLVAQSATSSPAKAALRIVPQSGNDPSTSPQKGDVKVDGTTGRMRLQDGSVWSKMIAQVYASVADSNTITNTTTETDFDTKYTFAAGALNQGFVTLKVRATLEFAWTGTPTFNLRLYVNGTAVNLLTVNLSTGLGIMEVDFLVRVRAANSTFTSPMHAIATGSTVVGQASAATPTLSAAAEVKLTGQWSAAAAANQAKVKIMTIEVAG